MFQNDYFKNYIINTVKIVLYQLASQMVSFVQHFPNTSVASERFGAKHCLDPLIIYDCWCQKYTLYIVIANFLVNLLDYINSRMTAKNIKTSMAQVTHWQCRSRRLKFSAFLVLNAKELRESFLTKGTGRKHQKKWRAVYLDKVEE